MIRVRNFKGRWLPDQRSILFTWDPDTLDNSVCIHFIEISGEGRRSRLNLDKHATIDLLQLSGQNSCTIFYGAKGLDGAVRRRFCAFADETLTADPAELNQAFADGQLATADVLLGFSEVAYTLRESKAGIAKVCSITLECSARIEPGILGYTYTCDDLTVRYPIMQMLEKGKTRLPPIAIPSSCALELISMEGGSSCIALRESKKFKLFK